MRVSVVGLWRRSMPSSALRTLWAMLGVDGGFHELQWPHPSEAIRARNTRPVRSFVACDDRARFFDLVGEFTETDVSVGRELTISAAPRLAVGRSWPSHDPCALWARCEGSASAGFLARFRPRPTLVLREGGNARYVALWALRAPLRLESAERGNKRIAHRLRAPKKWASPMEFRIPVPGTLLTAGRARPVPIVVAEHHPDALYSAREVAAHLPDPPPPKDWRNGR